MLAFLGRLLACFETCFVRLRITDARFTAVVTLGVIAGATLASVAAIAEPMRLTWFFGAIPQHERYLVAFASFGLCSAPLHVLSKTSTYRRIIQERPPGARAQVMTISLCVAIALGTYGIALSRVEF